MSPWRASGKGIHCDYDLRCQIITADGNNHWDAVVFSWWHATDGTSKGGVAAWKRFHMLVDKVVLFGSPNNPPLPKMLRIANSQLTTGSRFTTAVGKDTTTTALAWKSHFGNGPNTASERAVSNTELSEVFALAEFREESSSELLSAHYLCDQANSPSSFSQSSASLPQNSVRLSKFSSPKKYSRNSIPPISYHCFWQERNFAATESRALWQ